MRILVLVVMIGCSQPAPVKHEPEIGNHGAAGSNAGAELAACSTDADCTISYAGPQCCPPDPFCGAVVSRHAVEAFSARCKDVDCGPPKPSSSCMGWIGVTAVCASGRCERSDGQGRGVPSPPVE